MIPVSEGQIKLTRRIASFEISYPGAVASVNHYTGRHGTRIYVTQEAQSFMDAIGWTLKTYHVEDWTPPLTVIIGGRFRNLRACPDLHNLLKTVCDAIEAVTNFNDRNFKTETELPTFDKEAEPVVKITVKESDKVIELLGG